MRLRILALGALLHAAAATAAERPPEMPTRDVDVTYRMAAPRPDAPPLAQRMRWDVADRRLRVDPPSAGLYMIVDYGARRMSLVRGADRKVLDMEAGGRRLPGENAGAGFTRLGTAEVAGMGCTLWRTTDSAGQPVEACITADGVLLRARREGHTLVEAVSVAYGHQDPAIFAIPAGYQHVRPPPQ